MTQENETDKDIIEEIGKIVFKSIMQNEKRRSYQSSQIIRAVELAIQETATKIFSELETYPCGYRGNNVNSERTNPDKIVICDFCFKELKSRFLGTASEEHENITQRSFGQSGKNEIIPRGNGSSHVSENASAEKEKCLYCGEADPDHNRYNCPVRYSDDGDEG